MKLITAFLVMILAAPLASADFVERELGRDADGKVITGYVFEKGRRRSVRRSSLAPRRPSVRSRHSSGYYCYPVPIFYGSHIGCRSVFLFNGPRQGPFKVRVIR